MVLARGSDPRKVGRIECPSLHPPFCELQDRMYCRVKAAPFVSRRSGLTGCFLKWVSTLRQPHSIRGASDASCLNVECSAL